MLNRNQCRVILASGLMIGASMMFASTAKAGNSGDVSGVVAARNSVDYTAPTANQTLSPTTSSLLQFGSVVVLSNSSTGWTVTVDSANDGALKIGTGASAPAINYTTISASGSAGAPTPLTPNVTGTAASLATAPSLACATAPGCTYTLTATADSADGKPAGTYTDTLTFTITAP